MTGIYYAGAVVNLAWSAWAARVLGPTEFGQMAILVAVPSLVLSFFDVGPGPIVSRFVAARATSKEPLPSAPIVMMIGRASVGAAFVAAVGVGLLSPFVLQRAIDLGSASPWSSVVYAFSLVFLVPRTVAYGFFSATNRDLSLLLSGSVLPVLSLLAVGVVLQVAPTSQSVVFGLAVANGVSGIASALLISQQLRRDERKVPLDLGTKKEIYAALRWNFVTTTFGGLIAQAPVVLLGWGASARGAGYYRLSSAFLAPLGHLEAALRARALPRLSRAWSEGAERSLRQLVRRWLPLGWVVGTAAFGVVAGVVYFGLGVVTGHAFVPARTGTLFRAGGAAVSLAFFYLTPLLYARGEYRSTAIFMGIYGVAITALSWMLAPRFGFLAVAIGAAFCQVGFNVGLLVFNRFVKK